MSAMVSVIVPIYNVEKYLSECLMSLKNQTFQDIEVLCVNDGSTDDCLRIMKRFSAQDSRFKILDGRNGGYGVACNRGINAATGKYIGILESDDFADPDFYRDLVTIAEEHDCDFVKSEFYTYGDKSKRAYLSANFEETLHDVVFTPRNVLKNHNLLEAQSCIWSAIYRRDMLDGKNIRFLETPGASYQDLSFSVKVMMSSERAYFTRRAYVYYRQTDSQSIKSLGKWDLCFKEYAEVEGRYPMTPQVFASKYHNYMWTYNRVGIEHKFKVLERFSAEFKKHMIDNEHILDERLFHPWEPEHLKMITTLPLAYHDHRFQEIYDKEGEFNLPAEKPVTAAKPPEKVLISIIVPCYNVERYALSCLESLLNQKDADDIEIICVDDKSTDRTLEVLEYTARRDARVKVVAREVNGGLSAARNSGYNVSRGEFVLFVDSDDLLEINAVSVLKSKLKIKERINVINFSATPFPKEKSNDWLDGRFNKAGLYIEKTSEASFFRRKELYPFVWINLIRKSLLKEKGLVYDEGLRFGEDTPYLQELFTNTEGVLIIPEKLYRYRLRDNSLMSQKNADSQLNILRNMLDKMKAARRNFVIQPAIVEWAMDFVYSSIIHDAKKIKAFCDILLTYGYTDGMEISKHHRHVMEHEFNRRIREAGLS